jgi:hypothetical protein
MGGGTRSAMPGAMRLLMKSMFFTFLLANACGSDGASGEPDKEAGLGDAAIEAAKEAGASDGPIIDTGPPDGSPHVGPDCGTPPPVMNDPRCPPASSSFVPACTPCPEVGLQCSYPGLGDGMPNGCLGARGLTCSSMNSSSCSADAGGLYWIVTQ